MAEVWDVALADEGARFAGADTACWAADLSKFYERIPYGRLVDTARDMGFPSCMIKLALSMYGGAGTYSMRKPIQGRCTPGEES